MEKRVLILGSTGSIGTSALIVARQIPDRMKIVGLAAGTRVDDLEDQAKEFGVNHLCLADDSRYKELKKPGRHIYSGANGLVEIVEATKPDLVLVAIVGVEGLPPTLAAIELGCDVAVASKEILVMAGEVVMNAARRKGVNILPVDSEHNAIFQCLEGHKGGVDEVRRLIVTASGGPFRTLPAEELSEVKLEDALKHPTWEMGQKITIDSATLFNKGLEMIEARWLFDIPMSKVEVVVHPQSIVHSMVEFVDSSVIAQLSMPDMRLPITYALNYPARSQADWGAIKWDQIAKLEFEQPDFDNFLCLKLAYQAGETGETAPAWLNAANEIAVAAFLNHQIKWIDIPHLIAQTLDQFDNRKAEEEDDIYRADKQARRITKQIIESKPNG